MTNVIYIHEQGQYKSYLLFLSQRYIELFINEQRKLWFVRIILQNKYLNNIPKILWVCTKIFCRDIYERFLNMKK